MKLLNILKPLIKNAIRREYTSTGTTAATDVTAAARTSSIVPCAAAPIPSSVRPSIDSISAMVSTIITAVDALNESDQLQLFEALQLKYPGILGAHKDVQSTPVVIAPSTAATVVLNEQCSDRNGYHLVYKDSSNGRKSHYFRISSPRNLGNALTTSLAKKSSSC